MYDRSYDFDPDGGVALAADGGPAWEADPATVSGFRFDKYLVTVGRFRQFVSAVLPPDGGTGWVPAPGSGKHTHLNGGNGLKATGGGYELGWATADNTNVAPTNGNLACRSPYDAWTASAGGQENLPINCVNWYEAFAFCIWDGAFLPTEAEWEYVAAGGGQQRQYPWGAAAPGTGNQFAIYGCYFGGSGPGTCSGGSNFAPVGTAPAGAGLWGQLDLAGEVSEWALDDYTHFYANPCSDCVNLTTPMYRAVRGGGFAVPALELLPPVRIGFVPGGRTDTLGIRCARSP